MDDCNEQIVVFEIDEISKIIDFGVNGVKLFCSDLKEIINKVVQLIEILNLINGG